MSEVRDRIEAHVQRQPGVHFNAIVDELDLATGQVQYHLRRLRKRDDVISEEWDGRTHYFSPEYDPVDRQAIATLRRETSRAILGTLLDTRPLPPDALAEQLGLARSTVEWHLVRLVDTDLVDKTYDDRGRVWLSPSDAVRCEALLDEIDPGYSARLVDRFAALIDETLPEG